MTPDLHSRDFRLVRAGDSMLLIELTPTIDPAVNARVIALAGALEVLRVPGVRDIVPAYCSVAVHYDPLVTSVGTLASAVARAAAARSAPPDREGPLTEVPVCYGAEFGPDLERVAEFSGRSEAEVVRLHAVPDYRVYMLGFLPGFAYMGTVDAAIAMPRQPAPRIEVAAGSVGIAGRQTGVYTMASPGGWRIIGRTPLKPFDPGRSQPFLFAAGDRVRFVSIDRAGFERLNQWE